MKMTSFVVLAVLALSTFHAKQVHALADGLKSPNGIAISTDYPAAAQIKLRAALDRKDCQFVGGRFVNWISMLRYEGHTEALNGMFADLAECPGVTVTTVFRKIDEKCDWSVVHNAHGNSFEIQINVRSKRIDLEGLKLPAAKGPAIGRVKVKGPLISDGSIVSLTNRATKELCIDIEGETGKLMPLQPYTGLGGCDWVLRDVGKGYFSIQNRHSLGYLDVNGDKAGPVGLAEKHTPGGHGCDWRIVNFKNGHYKIVNRFWTDKKGKEIVLTIDKKAMPVLAPYAEGGQCDWKVERR